MLVLLSCPGQEPLHALLALPPLAWLVSTSVDVAERLQASVHRAQLEPTARPQAIVAAAHLTNNAFLIHLYRLDVQQLSPKQIYFIA